MCTLSYYPRPNTGYVLTHNRDELKQRGIADLPKFFEHAHGPLLFPRDPDAGGTWMAMNKQWSACLLNGAFDRYRHNPPYRRSRGLMLLDVFNFESIRDFVRGVDFQGIAPFTMVLAGHASEPQLHELRWDGTRVFHTELNHEEAHIWSAATLYVPEVRDERERWFAEFRQKNKQADNKQLIDFHKFGGVGDPNKDLVMQKDFAQTVSICQIRISEQKSMWYHDLIGDREQECQYSEK